MKKILLIMLVLTFAFSNISFASSFEEEYLEEIELTYFSVEGCLACQAVKTYLPKLIETFEKENIKITIKNIDVNKVENAKILQKSYAKTYGVKKEKSLTTPVIYVGDQYFIGDKEIIENLQIYLNEIKDNRDFKQLNVENISITEATEEEHNKFNTFSIWGVLGAGLLDGINPCAIAMLLFFLSFLSMTGKNGKTLLFVGFSYILATFLTYLGIGIGLFRFAYNFTGARYIMIFIYSTTIVMAIILSTLNFKDYISIKNGKHEKIKTQLPKKLKHIIHNFIRKNSGTKAILISAFISGIVVSCLEFFCTGQIYLPTIVYVISAKTELTKSILYLVLYNIAFILPLTLIVILIYSGKQIIDVSQELVSKMHIIKLIVSMFFILVSIIMLSELFKLI